MGPVQSKFARDPLRSYFDAANNEVQFLYFHFYNSSTHYFRTFCVEFANYTTKKCYWPTHSAITLNSRRHDVTSIERFDNQWGRLFTHDLA